MKNLKVVENFNSAELMPLEEIKLNTYVWKLCPEK
jgi:hypothetical protein